ncbi:OprD family outer membrane porin [Pseudomonas fluorescens]|uniref:OprD family outer membrane porin n=1 Tax=Pseudomonas fluorescens TaxID=294 RepID=UPI0012429033|nr:OprD family outer membrane porin [Pseudomonas fluorescens]
MKKQLWFFASGTAALDSLLKTANGVAFVEDSIATLELRNSYYNSDTRDTHKPTVDEWWQAFVLNVQSGFTQATIGLGMDSPLLWRGIPSASGNCGVPAHR